jgi:hypothetical protein
VLKFRSIPEATQNKKRAFGPLEPAFMDGVEGRFVGLFPESEKQRLHHPDSNELISQ